MARPTADIGLEFRWADGRTERLAAAATELVDLKVDVMVTAGTPAAAAASRATSSIPIVMATGVGLGTQLTKDSERRNANVTGISDLPPGVSEKRLQLLRDAVSSSALAILADRGNPSSPLALRETQAAAQSLGVSVKDYWIETANEFAAALTAMRGDGVAGFVMAPTPRQAWRIGEDLGALAGVAMPALTRALKLQAKAGFDWNDPLARLPRDIHGRARHRHHRLDDLGAVRAMTILQRHAHCADNMLASPQYAATAMATQRMTAAARLMRSIRPQICDHTQGPSLGHTHVAKIVIAKTNAMYPQVHAIQTRFRRSSIGLPQQQKNQQRHYGADTATPISTSVQVSMPAAYTIQGCGKAKIHFCL